MTARLDWNLSLDPALAARLRLAALPVGAPVRIIGRAGIFAWHGLDDGRARLRTAEGVELLAGVLAVEPVEELGART